MVTIKSKKEIELMREAGRVTALTHKAIEEAIKPGMTTADIDKTDISYYAQEHEILDTNKTILDNFKNFGLADYEIRRILGSFLFSGDDIYKNI